MARGRRSARSTGAGSSTAPPARKRRYNLRPTRRRRAREMGMDLIGRTWKRYSDEDFRKFMEALRVRMSAKTLNVQSLDLHKESNREEHHTDDYEKDALIVRRGQAFKLSIKFDRPINKEKDSIVLQLTTGARPQENKGSLLRLGLLNKKKAPARPRDWTVVKVDIDSDKVTATVVPYTRCIIGSYDVFVATKKDGDDEYSRYEYEEEDIYVLFNPWCKDDPVYMSEEDHRQEYVMRDNGRIWVGSAWNNRGRPWNFGQFDDPCLDAALTLIDKAELGDVARGSTVAILRAISALTNSNDDDGVLTGKWGKPYTDGKVPWSWIGSVEILKEYMKKGKPVKYGQCWVFSGVITTLLRALGIPSRSVTNFQSAHDTDDSMTIDSHWDKDDERIDWMDNDSVWNFHVWNEAWLRRLDLPKGYDGWQAVDATPQEVSEGVMRCGPASLKAVKEGHVYLSYDTRFIFSEVNGDKVHWKVDEDGSAEVMRIDSSAVGKKISTKSRGSNLREDVTHMYKYPEGSEKEREVVKFVNTFSEKKDIYETNTNTDIKFALKVPESASVSDDIEVAMVMKNISDEARTVKGRLSVFTSYYTGVPDKRLGDTSTELTIQAKQEERVVIKVTPSQYQSKLSAEASFEATANFRVIETKRQWADNECFTLVKPDLEIKLPGEIKVKESSKGTVTFTNPLEIKLTGSSLHVEGGVAIGSQVYQHKKAIAPGETISFDFNINPRRRGRKEVEASFSSDQLCGIDGSEEFRII